MIKRKESRQQFDINGVNDPDNMAGDNGAGMDKDGENANVTGCSADAADNTAETADTPVGSDDAAEWRDKYLRLSAEFDNYRKRTLKEKMDLAASGGKDVIMDILPVMDDIDRALEAARCVEDIESVRTGIELIAHKLRGVMTAKGLKEIEAVGSRLDTDFHEAIAKIPVADAGDKGNVVDVVQKGYVLKDNVIRHAKVVVGE